MNIYCLEEFKVIFEKLNSKKSYNSFEQEIISYFFGKTKEELCSGTRLNFSVDVPYIKKRLNGSGGFRCYFLLILKEENLYLMFAHPKTGSMGSSNIDDKSKAYLYKEVLSCIKSKKLYELKLNDTGKSIVFKNLQEVKI